MRGKREQTKQRKRKLIRILGISLGAILLLFLAAGLIAKLIITEEFLSKEIESSINSEVEIGNASVSLFSVPARITLSDVVLSPKEEDKPSDARIEIERVDLRLSLFSLLAKEFNVTSITVSGADITTTYREDGSTSVEELFSKSDEGDDSPASPTDGGERGEDSGGEKSDGFNAFEQEEFVATLGRLTIENSRANVLLEEMGVKLLCTNLNAELSEMRVDPERLQETDTARLNLSVDVKADSVEGWAYGEMFLSGEASARIFNPKTGETEPDVEGDFSLSKKSWLNTQVPVITKAWSLLGNLRKVGVNVEDLPERASFGRSEAIAVHYHLGKITVRKPLSIWVDDWELAALDNSWLDTGTDMHELNAELLASESASNKFLKAMGKGVDFLPKEARQSVIESITTKLYREGRLFIPLKSTEEFSDPKIRPSGEIPDLADAAKEAGEKLLKDKAKGLLEGLLNRD